MKTFGHDTALALVGRAFEQQVLERGLGKRPWGRALQRSDVVTHIVWPVVHRSWDLADVERPGPRSLVTLESATRLNDLVAERWVMIDALCRAGMAISTWVISRLEPAGLHVTPGRLSEPICTRLKAHYQGTGNLEPEVTAGTAPDEHDVTEIALDVCDFVVKRVYQALDRAEFARRFSSRYDQEWEARGRANLKAHPPSAVRLGDDVRPPLLPVNPRQPGSYLLGLGRSVYRRYSLYFQPEDNQLNDDRGGSQPDVPRREHDLTDHDGLADLEIRRTCSPYALFEPSHHGVVRAIARGVTVEDGPAAGIVVERAHTTWRTWNDEPTRPLEAADEVALTQAVAACAVIWQRRGATRELEFAFGSLADHIDDVVMAVTRKVWMTLHRQERDHYRPVGRRRLSAAMLTALHKAVPDVVQKRRTGALRTENTPAPDPYDTTLRLLATVPDHVRDWIIRRAEDDSTWLAEYHALIQTAGRAPAECLDDAELEDLLGQYGADDRGDHTDGDGTEDGDD